MGQEAPGGKLRLDQCRLARYLIWLLAIGEWSAGGAPEAQQEQSGGALGFKILMIDPVPDEVDACATRRKDPPGAAVLDT
eukprot:7054595-Pyramimonas_sp.AAC.1